jgi:hypothetical protein
MQVAGTFHLLHELSPGRSETGGNRHGVSRWRTSGEAGEAHFFSQWRVGPRGGTAGRRSTLSRGAEMKELIERIAKALVDMPEEVQVSEVAGENTIAVELRVAKEDLGKVIGRKGRTAIAMRTILNAAGTKMGMRYVLEILE